MRPSLRAVATLAAAAALVTGCSSGDDWSQPHPEPTAIGALGPGFVDPSAPPAPEATATPRPGSWTGSTRRRTTGWCCSPRGDDRPTKALVTAVKDWAARRARRPQNGGRRRSVTTSFPASPGLSRWARTSSSARATTSSTLSRLVTPNHLSQQFLVVGAELAEPTHNVTAVDWSGASFRGEGLGVSSTYDPASFTADRCAAAIRAGVAAVLNDLTGIVIWLDARAPPPSRATRRGGCAPPAPGLPVTWPSRWASCPCRCRRPGSRTRSTGRRRESRCS